MTQNQTPHPPSLRIFFATEMWERYGFYVVQSLLALYLALHFKWHDDRVYTLVGSFTALTYLSPVIGGWIADHLLGQKRSIILGTLVLLFSYLSLTLLKSDEGLTFSLAGIAVGTGLLKPNISSLLGNEYPVNSSRRESGFTIFYMGITTGIILGTTLPSIIYAHWGWPAAFCSAVFGMLIALTVFVFGIQRYKIADYHPVELTIKNMVSAVLLLLFVGFIAFMILEHAYFANSAFCLVIALALAYMIYSIRRESPEQARLNLIIGLLCIISVIFWAFYFQMFLSLTLFIARVVEPKLFGIDFPPPYYVGVQSIGMLLFGYFLSKKKKRLTLIESSTRTVNKFFLAILCLFAAYLLICIVSYSSKNTLSLLSPLYFIPAYLLISLAELLLSPTGLSAITVLANRKKVSTMMGIFFVSLGVGGFLSGKLATLTSISPDISSLVELKAHYSETFFNLLIILILATFICGLLTLLIKRILKSC